MTLDESTGSSTSTTRHPAGVRFYTDETLDLIRSMVATGYLTEAIAATLGVTVYGLRSACRDYRVSLRGHSSARSGRKLDPFRPPTLPIDPIKLYPSDECRKTLIAEAGLRGVSVGDLCVAILETIANDSLVAAVLDQD